jgi:hypothetical protein
MGALRTFELEAIRLMTAGIMSPAQLELLREIERPVSYEYTGSGYFLTVTHPSFPEQRCTLSKPAVVGTVGEVSAGFVVFLGARELTLECHTWGPVDVPADFRDCCVLIGTLPANPVDLRDGT